MILASGAQRRASAEHFVQREDSARSNNRRQRGALKTRRPLRRGATNEGPECNDNDRGPQQNGPVPKGFKWEKAGKSGWWAIVFLRTIRLPHAMAANQARRMAARPHGTVGDDFRPVFICRLR
jgi:hypothetical protein